MKVRVKCLSARRQRTEVVSVSGSGLVFHPFCHSPAVLWEHSGSRGQIRLQWRSDLGSAAKNEKQNVELRHPLALTPLAGSLVLTDVLLWKEKEDDTEPPPSRVGGLWGITVMTRYRQAGDTALGCSNYFYYAEAALKFSWSVSFTACSIPKAGK